MNSPQKPGHPRAIEFQAKINSAGLKRKVVEFDQSARRAQDAADAIGCQLGQIVKSLIFKGTNSGSAILVLTSGSNRVDEKKVRKIIGEKLSKADANFVRNRSGYTIGGVPPFGHSSEMIILMDEDFQQYELLWAAAGTPNAVFPISPLELLQITSGLQVNVKIEVSDA